MCYSVSRKTMDLTRLAQQYVNDKDWGNAKRMLDEAKREAGHRISARQEDGKTLGHHISIVERQVRTRHAIPTPSTKPNTTSTTSNAKVCDWF